MLDNCRVSFIVTSRNDNHGGDMLRRFAVFTDALLEQANRHSLSGELIVVEWNPPQGPRLHDALKLSVKSDCFAIRFIEVPFEAHRRIRNSDVIPLFQMIAKNVGVRRARGKFIVATNPDLLFSDSLISFLASDELRQDVMYRIDRRDVPADVPDNVTLAEQLAWCNRHVLRIHTRRGSFHPPIRLLRKLKTLSELIANIRWPRFIVPSHFTGMRIARAISRSVALLFRRLSDWSNIFYQPRRDLRRLLWGVLRLTDPLPKVHTNGCGDFTVLAKDQWFALKGYPELPLWSMHIDSLLCYMAVASGLCEKVLRPPAKLFHIEHGNSWVVMNPGQRLKTFASKPWLDIGLLSEVWEAMFRSRQPVVYNDVNWGLGESTFDELCILSGERNFISKSKELKVG